MSDVTLQVQMTRRVRNRVLEIVLNVRHNVTAFESDFYFI